LIDVCSMFQEDGEDIDYEDQDDFDPIEHLEVSFNLLFRHSKRLKRTVCIISYEIKLLTV
jgi:hypothetical protein